MVPFLLSAFIATIAAPPLFWLRDKGVSSNLALPLVIVGMVVALMLLGGLLASSSAFAAKLPFYQERLLGLQTSLLGVLDEFNIPLDLSSIITNLSPFGTHRGQLNGRGRHYSQRQPADHLTVVFILAEANTLTKLKHVLHNQSATYAICSLYYQHESRCDQNQRQHCYRRGDYRDLVATECGLSVALGLLAMLLNFLPTIGSIIAAVPPVMLAIIQAGPATAGAVAASFFLINMVMGNMVEPRFMGRGLVCPH